MKHIITNKRNTSRERLIATVALLLSAVSANADDREPKLTMTVFEDAAQGTAIVAGKYDKAIDTISAKASKHDVIRIETNLCVAYAKSGDIARAERSCNMAVAAIRSTKHFGRYAQSYESGTNARRRYLAIALSNRSVVNAIKGDYSAAQQDLDAARELGTRLAAVKTNLDRLSILIHNAA